jgi:multicomponent Na+:H+ antiporter subunit F
MTVISVLTVAAFACTIRLILGPTYFDRLVALNFLVVTTTAIMAILAVELNRHVYLDVALVYAILGFVSVIVISKYLSGKELHW